jgi:hypothetical protein
MLRQTYYFVNAYDAWYQGLCIYFFHVKIPLKAPYFEEEIYRNGEEGEKGGEKKT